MILGLWIAFVPFARPVPAGRPAPGEVLMLEVTPTIDCGPAALRMADDVRHDGACKNVARVRVGIAAVLFVGGAAVVATRRREDTDDEL